MNRTSPIPVGTTVRSIIADPYMTTHEKTRMVSLIGAATNGPAKELNKFSLLRAATGAGSGFVQGTLFANVFDTMFGKMQPNTRKLVQATGALTQSLRNTGILN